jgi:hypothetical protein
MNTDMPTDRPVQSRFEPSVQNAAVLFEQAKPLIHLSLPSSNPARRTDDLAISVRIPIVGSEENVDVSFAVKSNSEYFPCDPLNVLIRGFQFEINEARFGAR